MARAKGLRDRRRAPSWARRPMLVRRSTMVAVHGPEARPGEAGRAPCRAVAARRAPRPGRRAMAAPHTASRHRGPGQPRVATWCVRAPFRSVIHAPSTAVHNSWILRRGGSSTSWITALTPGDRRPYRRQCPKGPSRTGATEITSRFLGPDRSLRALHCPAGTAFCADPRVVARRDAIGIPVSILSSGDRSRGPRPSTPWTIAWRPACR
jgi:hypothetical protein